MKDNIRPPSSQPFADLETPPPCLHDLPRSVGLATLIERCANEAQACSVLCVDVVELFRGLPTSTTFKDYRWGNRGSLSVDLAKNVWFDHEAKAGGNAIDFVEGELNCNRETAVAWLLNPEKYSGAAETSGPREPRSSTPLGRIVATYDYVDETGTLRSQVLRYEPRDFRQRRPDGNGGWLWSTKGVPPLPYRLPEVRKAIEANRVVLIVEGEKDVDNVRLLDFVATSNAGGAGNWKPQLSRHFESADVILVPDNDDAGRDHMNKVGCALEGVAKRLRYLEPPNLPEKGDISDWIAAGGTRDGLAALIDQAPPWKMRAPFMTGAYANNGEGSVPRGGGSAVETSAAAANAASAPRNPKNSGVSLDDFVAYMPMHNYIFTPTCETWPAASVNSQIPPIEFSGENMNASTWLDRNKPVHTMTWAPGFPMLVENRIISEGGWIERDGAMCFNLYRPPVVKSGKVGEAKPWLNHVSRVYGDDAEHIIKFLAHRVQRPQEKINHALVLGGRQGIGKDTLLEPVKQAVGPWNFAEVSPKQILGRFNAFLKSTILRVNEARDLGDFNRFQFYDHMKSYTAAPPDVLRVDEKNLREYNVPNCTAVIVTTNHKMDGIFLPSDDRRHHVAWSTLDKSDFPPDYWNGLWKYYADGGYGHVAAYLTGLDIRSFDPKAPPPKTSAFWEIVDAHRAPEDAELADALDKLGDPDGTTIERVAAKADTGLAIWLTDRKNRRTILHRMEACGYVPVRNDTAKDGLWKIHERRQAIYTKAELSLRDRIKAARDLMNTGRSA